MSATTFGRFSGVYVWPLLGVHRGLDGQWHHVALVRRWIGGSNARIELHVDGAEISRTDLARRVDMRQWWDSWPGFGDGQEGWFWGAEKQAATGLISQYEDYKGLVDDLLFWSRARSPEEISATWLSGTVSDETGLVGHYEFQESSGTSTCDRESPGNCIELIRMQTGYWAKEGAPFSR